MDLNLSSPAQATPTAVRLTAASSASPATGRTLLDGLKCLGEQAQHSLQACTPNLDTPALIDLLSIDRSPTTIPCPAFSTATAGATLSTSPATPPAHIHGSCTCSPPSLESSTAMPASSWPHICRLSGGSADSAGPWSNRRVSGHSLCGVLPLRSHRSTSKPIQRPPCTVLLCTVQPWTRSRLAVEERVGPQPLCCSRSQYRLPRRSATPTIQTCLLSALTLL